MSTRVWFAGLQTSQPKEPIRLMHEFFDIPGARAKISRKEKLIMFAFRGCLLGPEERCRAL